jgi:hypothetical protein
MKEGHSNGGPLLSIKGIKVVTSSSNVNDGQSGHNPTGALVVRLESGALVSILFGTSDLMAARIMIQEQVIQHPLDSMELHFANFNASLLTELRKRHRNDEATRVFAAAAVEFAGRLTGHPHARCMVAETDHRFVGPDKQFGSYDLFAHTDPVTFIDDVTRSLPVDSQWRPL